MSEAYEAYERRVRERAHQIWVEEGRPDGRAEEHWARAREQVSEEEGVADTLKPVDGPEAESLIAVESLGDLPGRLNDQGERQDYPSEPAKKTATARPKVAKPAAPKAAAAKPASPKATKTATAKEAKPTAAKPAAKAKKAAG